MTQSSLHVAIIMDGNGRWAERRGLPRTAGHRVGATAVRRIVEAAPAQGIRALTLFAFSADNWKRPAAGGERVACGSSPDTCAPRRRAASTTACAFA